LKQLNVIKKITLFVYDQKIFLNINVNIINVWYVNKMIYNNKLLNFLFAVCHNLLL